EDYRAEVADRIGVRAGVAGREGVIGGKDRGWVAACDVRGTDVGRCHVAVLVLGADREGPDAVVVRRGPDGKFRGRAGTDRDRRLAVVECWILAVDIVRGDRLAARGLEDHREGVRAE